ncbi:MAG: hypothetical protein QGG39_17420, partial [Candidatus Poribacteria bacterium]|nr:hypothetical protein [Candidatus Poribacteria bacterium]
IGPSYVVDKALIDLVMPVPHIKGPNLVDNAHKTIITIHLHLYQIAYAGDKFCLIHAYRIPFVG